MRSLAREILGTTLFGLATVVVFVAGGVAWSTQAPLVGSVIAPGRLTFEGERKTVQHLEGGIIHEIKVKEGDRVAAGAVLLTLDDTSARARAEELLGRMRALAAESGRLRAERAGAPAPVFDHPALRDAASPAVAAVIAEQNGVFAARRQTLETREAILRKRIDQLSRERQGLRKQLVGVRSQLGLVRQEEATVAELLDKGYARRPRLLAIRRAEAGFVASEGEILATLARLEEQENETKLQIAGLATDVVADAAGRLAKVQAELASVESLYRDTRDRLTRTRVRAPVAGVVLDLRVTTVGGVIAPGEPILDIAPMADRLVVEARVRPTDIDEVEAGSPVMVTFPAYPQRNLAPLPAQVTRVSADALTDPDSHEAYYAVLIEIEPPDARNGSGLHLVAGMPAEVFITTAERTVYDYMAEPIRRIFDRAMRES